MIEKYITEISANVTFGGEPYYYYLNTQLEYLKASRELFLSRK